MQLTNSKHKNKQIQVSDKIKRNINNLINHLQSDDNQIITISSSSVNQNQDYQSSFIQHVSPLVKQLIANIENPYKSIIIISQLLKKSYAGIQSDPIFNGTLYHQSLHPILTTYLHTQTSFLHLKSNPNRIIDVFYKYLLYQQNTLMQITLQGNINNQHNIGNWFKQQCLIKMFKIYYSDPLSYTIYLSNYMNYGLSYIFLSAAKILKNDQKVLKQNDIQQDILENIQIAYIKKYRLDTYIQNWSYNTQFY